MRFFVCTLDGMALGFPADKTERIITASQARNSPSEAEKPETEDFFIALPALFRRSGGAGAKAADERGEVFHGIVLKDSARAESRLGDGRFRRYVFLTPKIDIDLDIPEADIHPLPNLLGDVLPWFSGVSFSNGRMLLLLDPEKIAGDTA
jgi:hypothetical protein